jgi:hypothetical protein
MNAQGDPGVSQCLKHYELRGVRPSWSITPATWSFRSCKSLLSLLAPRLRTLVLFFFAWAFCASCGAVVAREAGVLIGRVEKGVPIVQVETNDFTIHAFYRTMRQTPQR